MTVTEKLAAMGVGVPAMPAAVGAYLRAKRVGDLVYVAGQLPMRDGTLMATGQVPKWCSLELATQAARQCAVNALAAAASVVPLDELTGVLRVGAFVASDNGFHEQPKVANGASEFLVEVFGEAGRHVRAAV